ncbi:MAG: hypothetical protein AB1324_04235 [Candidatus Micrarchaeota archaeon]
MVSQIISPGKNGVLSADASVQALVTMWDRNLLILGVERRLAKAIKNGDYVLVDYRPVSPQSRQRKLSVMKILPPSEGSKIWGAFQDELERRKAVFQQMRARHIQR